MGIPDFATYLLAFLLVSSSTPVVYLDMQRGAGERKALNKTTPVLIFEKTGREERLVYQPNLIDIFTVSSLFLFGYRTSKTLFAGNNWLPKKIYPAIASNLLQTATVN